MSFPRQSDVTGVANGSNEALTQLGLVKSLVAVFVCTSCIALPGCVRRDSPTYRAPLVSTVTAESLPIRRQQSEAPRAKRRTPNRQPTIVGKARPPSSPSLPKPRPQALQQNLGNGLTLALRSKVGLRNKNISHTSFALTTLGKLGFPLTADSKTVKTGAELVELAKAKNAFRKKPSTVPGDLLVFQKAQAGKDTSVVGVVVGQDSKGTIEFIYIVRGIVRRGYVNANHPGTKRDRNGAILNTFVRHGEHRDPRNMKYLAGELLEGAIRTADLSMSRNRVSLRSTSPGL